MRTQKPKKTRKKVECYDSMKSAAAGMSIPLELLTEAKNLGAAGFRASRIYGAELRAWLDSNPLDVGGGVGDDSLIGLRKQFLRAQINRENFKLAALRGEHIAIAEVTQSLVAMAAETSSIIRQIEDEIPSLIAGLAIADARLAIRSKFDAMRRQIHAPLVEFQKAQVEAEKSK